MGASFTWACSTAWAASLPAQGRAKVAGKDKARGSAAEGHAKDYLEAAFAAAAAPAFSASLDHTFMVCTASSLQPAGVFT